MGFINQSVGAEEKKEKGKIDYHIALAGNPNTGKSTVFNSLTGLHQHTGNWAGKTVANEVGHYKYENKKFAIMDLPGTYSLDANSKDEEEAKKIICDDTIDVTVVVVDATTLERNLILLLEIMQLKDNVILCVNLMDEARKKKIHIDVEKLSSLLQIPVVSASARGGEGIEELKNLILQVSRRQIKIAPFRFNKIEESNASRIKVIVEKASEIVAATTTYENEATNMLDRKIDNVMMSKIFGIPIMLFSLGFIFWLTIVFTNYPSMLLQHFFLIIQNYLLALFTFLNFPPLLTNMLVFGLFKTLSWIIAVMLPPMAIFFPLFGILEDFGFLPRIAFNLDYYFKKVNAHGKQALTMCMGFGCNAAGVTACRIIESKRERMMAVITNNFVPCNGRFPTLIILSTIFIAGTTASFRSFKVAFIVLICILTSVLMTFFISYVLSITILKGMPSSFTLELPPYRRPQFLKVILKSVTDRTLFVLGRAIVVAIPAGIIIWILQNIYISDVSVITHIANFLNPFANLMGLDGYILCAFILGMPANEIVIPIIIMCYTKNSSLTDITSFSELGKLFFDNGWTYITAICTMLFSLNHFPCSTTLLTIYKETKSIKWTLASFFIPTATGIIVCIVVANVLRYL